MALPWTLRDLEKVLHAIMRRSRQQLATFLHRRSWLTGISSTNIREFRADDDRREMW
jgi:hypothetical protein